MIFWCGAVNAKGLIDYSYDETLGFAGIQLGLEDKSPVWM